MATQMDYFEQKSDLDLTAFFKAKGMKLGEAFPISTGGAPPPKDMAWAGDPDRSEEEAQQ